ncbi:MAG: N-acetylglucosamine-6-phosphate deacetylase [Spirochaetaceae bacterium]|nr:N-acetylglucosamine-6-phosphate deacetylase [Spirochaetaceae bacterium]
MRTVLLNGTVFTGYAKLENCGVYIEDDGTIGDIFNMKRYDQKNFPKDTIPVDVKDCYIMPGFIDSHIHGIGGYGTEDDRVESILGMSERLADFGVTRFQPTIYTDTPEQMIKGIKAIVQAMGHEKGAIINGVNLEGPFISPKRIGAQAPEGVKEVDLDLFHTFLEAGEGHIVCMTVAPELKHMRALALEARKAGVVLLAGHTDATYENIIEGMQCGILHSTHFFNAMSRLHHRNPGTVGAIMIQTNMCCEIICDGVHVHPELVKLLLREKPIDNIVLITDALKPTKQRSGELLANRVPAVLSHEGAFISKENEDLFLGSSLTMLQGIKNLTEWGISLSDAVQMSSTNPARIYSINKVGSIIPEYKADLTILNKDLELKALFIEGKLIRDRLS